MYQNITFLTVQLQHHCCRIILLRFWWLDDVCLYNSSTYFLLHRSIQNLLDRLSTIIHIWLQSKCLGKQIREPLRLGPHYRSGESSGGGHRKPGNGSWPPSLPDSWASPCVRDCPQFSEQGSPVGGWPAQQGRREMFGPSGHKGQIQERRWSRSSHSCLCPPSTLWQRLLLVWPASWFTSGFLIFFHL